MSEKVEKLIRKRSSIKSKLTIFGNYLNLFKTCSKPSSEQFIDLDGRFKRFDDLYDIYDALQCDIEVLCGDPDKEREEREQFEDQYHKLVATARSLLSTRPPQKRESQDGSVTGFEDAQASGFKSHCVRLPKINLPTFNGQYQHWLEFRDTFVSLIHSRTDIDEINKLHYLRASLKGSALLIIDSLDFKSSNYESAWNLITNRYNNEKLLVNNHVQALFNVDPITEESCSSIRHIIDITNKNLRALATLDQPTQYWDTLIIHMMSSKLDKITRRQWEENRNLLSNSPTLNAFLSFLSNRADLLETLQEHSKGNNKIDKTSSNSNITMQSKDNQNSKKNVNNKQNQNNKKSKCPVCSQNHTMYFCKEFKSLSIEDRIQKAKDAKVCLNCLHPGHVDTDCRYGSCKYCKKKHCTLLHLHGQETTPQPPMPDQNFTAAAADIVQLTTASHVLLSTALVKVADIKGNLHSARVLLDNGSTANYVTDSLCGKLGLSRRSTGTTVTGINNQTSQCTQSCSLTIMSSYNDYSVSIDCHILPHITKALPAAFINIDNIAIPMGVGLADPRFNIPSVIDILVGAEIFWSVLSNNLIDLGKNKPKLYETQLGWLVSGYVGRSKSQRQLASICNFTNESPDLTRFWELDTVANKHSFSAEERACEKIFLDTTVRKKDGRFVVTIPLKKDPSVLGDSYFRAKHRFLSLERRFSREPKFKNMYLEFLREYELLGHMTENQEPSPHSQQSVRYYMPHHGVIRESSVTTKLRTVFDASAVTRSGLSFNDIQMVGPTVQEDIYSILVRFRQHKYVVAGDVEKMYRAIEVHPLQRPLQQIIFRYSPEEPLKTYTLNTVTYGTASAPYLATKCLVSLASDATIDSDVRRCIQRDFYVDDYLGGSSTIEKTIKLCKGVISTLKSAQFILRKFKSNNLEILKQVSPCTDSDNNILDLSSTNTQSSSKTLGLNWICDTDNLSFVINMELHSKVTKRHILSVISKIFDPLGLVAPCIVEAKIIMQKLWLKQYDWDDEVSQEIKEQWLLFANTLPLLNHLKIPRWVITDDCLMCEMHIFSDASEAAYGACIYIRSLNHEGPIKVQLLTAKSRVAPTKPTTIPRLELCGALLAARLCAKVLASLTLSINKCSFWCDSTIVLGWLSTPSLQLKNFVKHRVHEIQESTAGHSWNYVPSAANPADLVSRGLNADYISASSLWWSGPTFLMKGEHEWPSMPNNKGDWKIDLPDVVGCHSVNNNNTDIDLILTLINNRSSFSHLQRSVAYVQRFIHNCQNKINKIIGELSVEEHSNSLNLIIRKVQLEMFPKEYAVLKGAGILSKKNRLKALSPFLDHNNVLRVGGRLDNSPYSYDTKHPILLCSKHHFTKMLFRHFHIKFLHNGPQSLLSNIRQTYWTLGGRNLSKCIVNKCVLCCRYKAETVQPIMGQLPSSRTELEFPFLHCSVDYAGPVLIADRKGRGCKLIKSYLAIFICNSVKACHIELVTALSTDAYIAALKRFVARRGKPQSITSDNGTNFVGTYNELSKFLEHSDLEGPIAEEGIEFKFVPAYSPHFNGLAEAAVRSTKHHLRRLLQTTHFTFEEMTTCLCQIEAVLNSRPLTPLSSDPLDLSPLTPSHFLIGRCLMGIPHPQVSDVNIDCINRLERFKRIEVVKQHFWKRFSLEYVTLLQQKVKWQSSNKDLKLGALVLIKDRALPPMLWSLGRVVNLYPGSDGISRVAEIKTKRGTIRRAYNNICPLPDS